MPQESGPAACPFPQRSDPRAAYAVGALVAGVRRFADRLEAAARELHAGDGLTVGERALLLQLRQGGHQTIPALAARRGTTRQYVQQTLAPLAGRGLVEWRENPRHRRSRLAALSPAGVELARRVLAREGALAGELAQAVPSGRLGEAAAVLGILETELARALPAILAAGPGTPGTPGTPGMPAMPAPPAPRAAAAEG
jgi:DNA-binding MarR family transcriptional regulator